ncbi:EcsC family protein [Brachybacterium sp. FME24]|uniref:EcsC family protein n=1 Tax=Brachybacterium sp. FME24 TaxID=2742605 RepID=UPI001869328F|nr:EcsC family protein [Brachybacterium sp. FME24]
MGILGMLRRDEKTTNTAREALKEARQGSKSSTASDGGALHRMVEAFRDIGLDGKLTYSSAQDVAARAQRGRARKRPEKAVRRLVRRHRRGVTIAGFLTGLGGVFTLPVLLPTNVVEFYVHSTRMVGAIAVVRGYDLDDEEIRVRVLAALLGEESGDVLKNIGLGPVAGVATRSVAKRLPKSTESAVASAIGGRILRKFGLRSVRLFGKAIPGLGGVLGAIADRAQLNKIAKAATASFPPVA